jgi:hypothetical protein
MPILSDDRITEMKHALEQRMMIGVAVPGDTNKSVTILTADAEFPEMIIDVSNQLYATNVFTTFGPIDYAFLTDNQTTPHQFTIQIGDFRNVDPVA